MTDLLTGVAVVDAVALLADDDSPVSAFVDGVPEGWEPTPPGLYLKRAAWHAADRPGARARLKRRGFPIRFYGGPNGSGKSWVCVYDAIPSLLARRFVLSTVRLIDFENPRPCPGGEYCDDPAGHDRRATVSYRDPMDRSSVIRARVANGRVHAAAHPFYVPLRSYSQIVDAVDCDLIFDEVTGVASSRESMSMPAPVLNLLVQLRRRNVTLSITSPAWGRMDKVIREVCQLATICAGHAGKRRPTPANEAPRLWTDKRVFIAKSYHPSSLEEFEARRAETVKPEIFAAYCRPSSVAEVAYDTLDGVSSLGFADASGSCITCGGHRQKDPCSCDDYLVRRAEVKARSVRP